MTFLRTRWQAFGVLISLTVSSAFFGCAAPEIGNTNGFSPFWRWKQIETEHFRLAFPEQLEPLAQKASAYLEEAHAILSPRLHWQPFKKTSVVLVDNQDDPNGWTSPQLRPGITLFAAMPGPATAINYYEDWLRLLIIHEYTHFLNMDTTEGLYAPARWIFGDTLLPNVAWHPWMLEGLAVYMETRHSRGGRGRSTYWDMLLRAAVLDGTLDTADGVTLDRMTGTNPYFPGGDTQYLYGYSVMRQVARSNRTSLTTDREDPLTHPEDVLGLLSHRSGSRFPYLSGENVENLTGKWWNDHWTDWVTEARAHAERQLATVRKQSVTAWTWLTRPAHNQSRDVIATAVSPDGRWLAYSSQSANDWEGLWVRDLTQSTPENPVERRIGDTLGTEQISWSSDSRWIFLSTLNRNATFELFYDLAAYDIHEKKFVSLSHGRRTRDPDISRDGSHLTYILGEHGRTSLAICDIDWSSGRPELKNEKRIYAPEFLSRVASPRFSLDGSGIYFTQHRNGHFSEELLHLKVGEAKPKTVVDNGKFNRFPWVTRVPNGTERIYYVSDLTGIDNLNILGEGQVSNVETGLRTPSVTPDGTAYVAGFSSQGWDVAQFQIASPSTAPIARVEPPLEPADDAAPPQPSPPAPAAPVSSYSAWPSILPRSWSPNGYYGAGILQASAQAYGNDALDFHRYEASLGYILGIPRLDWALSYANRQLGPTVTFSIADATNLGAANGVTFNGGTFASYKRRASLATDIQFPFRFTFSKLTPIVAFTASQENLFIPGSNPNNYDLASNGTYVPTLDAGFKFSYARSSPLAIATEEAHASTLAARTYVYSGTPSYKLYAAHTETFRLGESHVVISPSVKASYASPSGYSPALVNVAGRLSNFDGTQLLSGQSLFATNGLDKLSLRGYPLQTFVARGAAVASLDVKFPIFRVFRGIGTFPAFFQNLHGFGFAESALFPDGDPGAWALPSVGGGLQFDLQALLYLPISTSLQYQWGARADKGGQGDFVFLISSSGLGF